MPEARKTPGDPRLAGLRQEWMAGFAKVRRKFQWQFSGNSWLTMTGKPRETRGIVVEFPILSNTETDSEILCLRGRWSGDRLLAVTHPLPAVQLSWTGVFNKANSQSGADFSGKSGELAAFAEAQPRGHGKKASAGSRWEVVG